MLPNAQTWIAIRTMIQDSFQWRLNATAPTTSHQGYAPTLPFQQNTFSALGELEDNNNDIKVATQVATLTYQSQLTASTAANTSIRQEQQLAHLASQQSLMHENMHKLINQHQQ